MSIGSDRIGSESVVLRSFVTESRVYRYGEIGD